MNIWTILRVKMFLAALTLVFLSACFHDNNIPPVAIAGGDRIVQIDEVVDLDGSDSFDIEGSELSFTWALHVSPDRSRAEIHDVNSISAFFIPDRPGTYVVSLVVNDGDKDSQADTVKIVARAVESPSFNHDDVTGTCISCHNGSDATGKADKHFATTDNCDACHITAAWSPVMMVDHSQVIGACDSCHNGTLAQGKSPTHIETSDACDACHSTAAWTPATEVPGTPDGSGGNGNNSETGKPDNHIATTDMCEKCHTDGVDLPPTIVDHSQVFGTCDSCHSKPATHLQTGRQCNVCHTTDAWIPALSDMPTEQPAGHILTTAVCTACHNADAWLPAVVDHSQVIGSCVSCHNNVVASGKSDTHFNTTDTCDACHAPGPEPWAPLPAVDHTQVLGTCESCHDGILASGMSDTHIATDNEPCDQCHSTDKWIPAIDPGTGTDPGTDPGTGNVPDHSQLVDTCVSCHNNIDASGKSATHIDSSNLCDECHLPAPAPWVPATVDHNQVLGVCSACHDGVIASGVSLNHPEFDPAIEECDACHVTTTWRVPAL